jgi:8-oxo-dGTP diphosphatase
MSEFLTLEEMLRLDGVDQEANVSYIPLPNTVDVVISNVLSPDAITPTAFAFNFFDNGDVLLAHNRRRQVEVPGGHRDPLPPAGTPLNELLLLPVAVLERHEKEHPAVAAARETLEETGATVSDLRPIGFMRSRSDGVRPDAYKYPWPHSCQQFFAASIDHVTEFQETDECRPPVRLTHEQVEQTFKGRTLALYRAAREALFPQATPQTRPSP